MLLLKLLSRTTLLKGDVLIRLMTTLLKHIDDDATEAHTDETTTDPIVDTVNTTTAPIV